MDHWVHQGSGESRSQISDLERSVLTLRPVCRLLQCRPSEDGLLIFITDIPEQAVKEQEKEAPVLQESLNGEQTHGDGGTLGLKSVLSAGKTQSSWADGGDRPVVTFKENIKPREPSRDPPRSQPQKDVGKERRDFCKGNGAAGKGELKRDGKRKSEVKKSGHEKSADAGKQVPLRSGGQCVCLVVAAVTRLPPLSLR